MPISLSAKRALRKSVANYQVNRAFKDEYKKLVKQYLAKPGQELLNKVFSSLDKAVKSHVFHKNKSARLKSQLAKKLSTKEVSTTPVARVKKTKVAKKM